MGKITNITTPINFLYNLRSLKDEDIENKNEIEFLGACYSNLFKTDSQNFQDVWALYENDFKQFGYYVEFGATNGIISSNTLLLEKNYMWSGMLAEPNPFWQEDLKKNRSSLRNVIIKDCVYDKTDEMIDFVSVRDADLSTISGFGLDDEHANKRKDGQLIKVRTITLFDMLKKYEAPKDINYMSVDTEGSEYSILKCFFDNPESKYYNIKCVTIEHNFIEKNRSLIYDLMVSNGYKRKFEIFSRWDDFYVKG